MIYANSSGDEFEEWYEKNDDELWISYHESLACYDTDYDDWIEFQYELYLKRKEGLNECIGN